jgi:hypothetical protein
MKVRSVEVLAFEGCPNVDAALDGARAAIGLANVEAEVRLVLVESDESARRLRFLGSPSVHVDGIDVEPSAATREDYGLQCRVYAVGGRMQGAPPTEWIAAALRGERPQERS